MSYDINLHTINIIYVSILYWPSTLFHLLFPTIPETARKSCRIYCTMSELRPWNVWHSKPPKYSLSKFINKWNQHHSIPFVYFKFNWLVGVLWIKSIWQGCIVTPLITVSITFIYTIVSKFWHIWWFTSFIIFFSWNPAIKIVCVFLGISCRNQMCPMCLLCCCRLLQAETLPHEFRVWLPTNVKLFLMTSILWSSRPLIVNPCVNQM